jgi:hypothetical protein
MRKELLFLQECWDRCCTKGTELPLYKGYDISGKIAFAKSVVNEEGIDDEERQGNHEE